VYFQSCSWIFVEIYISSWIRIVFVLFIDEHGFSCISIQAHVFIDVIGFHGFGDSGCPPAYGGLWRNFGRLRQRSPTPQESNAQVLAAGILESWRPGDCQKYPGPGSWDPRVMEAWRHAGLEPVWPACCLTTRDGG
jgi:hypothetical protein